MGAGIRWMARRMARVARVIIGPFIGASFAVVVLCTSVFGNYIVTLFLPMITIANRHRRYRELMDRAITFWMVIPLYFLHYVYRVKVRASGDRILHDAPAIIIMNHRTRLDWFYFWSALWRINPWLMTTNKIALKQLLRHIPGAGFGMQGMHYVFLKRDLETDVKRLSEAVDYYSAMGQPYQLLMFPEGTDKTEYTTRRSAEYARKNGLVPMKNVLYPRTSGFVRLIQEMKKRNYLSYIYDVTVAYPEDIVQNETDMIVKGNLSSTVHYDIRRIAADEIPTESDESIHNWLLETWKQKDAKLERFYAQKLRHKRHFETSGERNVWVHDSLLQRFAKIYGFWFWFLVASIWLYHIHFLLHVQVGIVFLALNYLYIYGVYGGIDHLVYHRWVRLEIPSYDLTFQRSHAEDLLSKMASAHLDYEPIMLAVHSTMNFLEHIVNQANNWDDFVSYALLLRDGEETALGAAARLWRCYAPVRTKLSLHVVWHRPPLMGTCVAQLPYNVQTQLNEFGEGSETNCGNFGIEEALELVHNRSLYSELPCIMYPINLMRNVARLGGTATRLQIVADSENVFSEGFARHMRPLTTRYMRDAGAKTLIAYRRFEISKTDLPKNVNELNELLHHGKANPFHKRFFSVGHNIPCLTWWLNYSTTHDVEYIVADELNYTNAHFEPQFIMPTDAPLHYEDVPTRYFDHQFLVNELCRAGYRFRIASHVFNMHAGVKTEFSITEKLTVSLARDRKRVILKEFSRYLLEKYGANRNHCPQLKE